MIATLLRYFRNVHNLKQKTVADLLGMSQANYSDLENGKTKLSIRAAEKLAKYYGISSSQFYTDNHFEANNSTAGSYPEPTANRPGNKQSLPVVEKEGSVQSVQLSTEEIRELALQIKKIADTSSRLLNWLVPNNHMDLR
jgi:transcriptional regulator with XRE-family HTH domain